MRIARTLLALVAVVCTARAGAALDSPVPLKVCLHYDAKTSKDVQKLIQEEIARYEEWLGAKLSFDCAGPAGVFVAVLGRAPAGMELDALGATRLSRGVVMPEVVVFRETIRELLPVQMRMEGTEARAIARVVAHELGHYLTASTGHRRNGVNDESLTAGHLLSPPPRKSR